MESSIAYHEAGHAVAHSLYARRKSRIVTIVPGEGFAGFHKSHASCAKEEFALDNVKRARRIMAAIVVMYAGEIAQRIFSPRSVSGSRSDEIKACELSKLLTRNGEEGNAILSLQKIRAKIFLSDPLVWAAVQAVASQLLIKKTISGSKVETIIGGATRKRFSEYSASKI